MIQDLIALTLCWVALAVLIIHSGSWALWGMSAGATVVILMALHRGHD